MEPVDLLNQTRVIRSDELAPGLKSFIFNKALPPSPLRAANHHGNGLSFSELRRVLKWLLVIIAGLACCVTMGWDSKVEFHA
jgi:hypothetical protein